MIDTKRDNEDRINTICNILCSVLNRCYIYSQIEQLIHDIKICADIDIDNILDSIGETELDQVEKTGLLLSLELYKEKLDLVSSSLIAYPLLRYRIELYSKYILRDSQSIYQFLQRHEKRVRWHIMRIYRNRNMIVHSGLYMPYRNMIIENLHYYVDALLDTLIEYYLIGLLEHQSIYRNILNEETNYLIKLGVSLKNKKQTTVQITSENALQIIFNGYNGNIIKKTAEIALQKRQKEHMTQLSLIEGDK